MARALAVGVLLIASFEALAQQCAVAAARVVSIQGSIELRHNGAQRWQAARSGAALCSGDSVRVGQRSRAALLLPNETTLRLDQGTTLTLSAPDQAQASLLDLILGTIHVISRTPRPFRVNTPYLNAGVEGTEFLVGSDEAGARLAVFEGRVSARAGEASLMLVGGEIAYAAKDAPLRKERMLRPADAVQWALYYPTLFDHRLGEQIAGTPGEAALRESIALYRQDRLAEAIFRLDKAPEGLANPRFLTYRAGLLLLVGRADEARSDIERALAVDAGNSNAHALKSVVALTQNDKDQALKLATQAVELNQASPVARLALSYAQQAHFKIEEALATVQKAVDLDPQNALAWARLAELHMSTGYLDRALEAAKRAVSLDPEVAKTQSVLGFANLTRIDTQAAKQAFQKAIDLDQADPLPRLGLGLAMIREGELSAGREQLEIAVCLDPENSLLRSYVGKAYYEEKRDGLAGIQFDLAKERDPKDPTPWFYDALARQSENAPIQAFTALQGALDRNDARAVTRSRLLLDQDKATISASLAGVYNSLGFEQLARSVVYGELENDPTNAALHNLLAESYLGLPLLDVARASEALQAKLNQPVGTLFSEPLLAESRLFLLKPMRLSAFFRSDAARLLDKSGVDLVAEGLIGNNDTAGSGLFLRGTNGRLAASATQAYFRSDGLRPEEPFKTEVSNVFLQFGLPNGSDVQIEAVRSYIDRGELIAAFDPDSRLGLSDQERFEQYRFGFKHSFGAQTDVLLSAIKQKGNFKQGGLGLTFEDTDSNTTTVETQVALATDRSRFVVGAGTLTGRTKSKTTDLAPEPFDSKRSQNNVYLQCRRTCLETLMFQGVGVRARKISSQKG
jgi:tetratricopeptide (TPR) repeat protein